MTNTLEKVRKIKENDQDFEWYPTTKEMIEAVFLDIQDNGRYTNDRSKLLDIGAGDGNLFRVWDTLIDKHFPLDEHGYRPNLMNVPEDYYGIEKSNVLMEYWPKNIIPIGTDFEVQTLIDKEMDFIFCNPPYSKFEQWTEKIILEANATCLYLVIPQRWADCTSIWKALDKRNLDYKVIYNGDFLNADRAARAKIDIVRIDIKKSRYDSCDPFGIWFDSHFQSKKTDEKLKAPTFSERKNLVKGNNLIERLENMYLEDMEKIRETYYALCDLDPALFTELEINLTTIKETLKVKYSGLKNTYWKELFDNLTKITSRLTSKSRKRMLEKLMKNVSVDFSAANAYSVVLWAIKNANEYYDSQLIDCYENLVSKESVMLYKSNKRFVENSWRYNNPYDFVKNNKNYYLNDKLDYRIVTHKVGGIFNGESWRTYDQRNGLTERAYDYVYDLCTVAKNLGYDVNTESLETEWCSGKPKTFTFLNFQNGKEETFMVAKAFKNGNMHFKFNQDFLRKLNVEFGRLKGWLNDKSQASEEMNIPMDKIENFFGSNHVIKIESANLLLESN